MISLNVATGVRAQRAFFKENNPTQPVFGGSISGDAADAQVETARTNLQTAWRSAGLASIPRIKDLAISVGLPTTYDYIYFAASNFVHFNPQTLLRTGWGPEGGPFKFSIENMDPYYRQLVAFYGTVMFIGYEAAFGDKYWSPKFSSEVLELLEHVSSTYRWPEIVTFEEMNVKPPVFFLTYAMGKVMRDGGEDVPFGAILRELQSLRV